MGSVVLKTRQTGADGGLVTVVFTFCQQTLHCLLLLFLNVWFPEDSRFNCSKASFKTVSLTTIW